MERRIHVETIDNFVSGEISWFRDLNGVKPRERSAQMWRRQKNVHFLFHVRAFGDCSVSSCGGHTATVGTRARGTRSVVLCGVASLIHRHVLEQGSGQKSKQDPLVHVNRREDSQTGQNDTLGVHVC